MNSSKETLLREEEETQKARLRVTQDPELPQSITGSTIFSISDSLPPVTVTPNQEASSKIVPRRLNPPRIEKKTKLEAGVTEPYHLNT